MQFAVVCQDFYRAIPSFDCFDHGLIIMLLQILFLNKIDLFAEKLPRSPLEDYFPDYTGGNNYDAACDYLLHRFVSLNQSAATKQIYAHYTCATDTQQIKCMTLFPTLSITFHSNFFLFSCFERYPGYSSTTTSTRMRAFVSYGDALFHGYMGSEIRVCWMAVTLTRRHCILHSHRISKLSPAPLIPLDFHSPYHSPLSLCYHLSCASDNDRTNSATTLKTFFFCASTFIIQPPCLITHVFFSALFAHTYSFIYQASLPLFDTILSFSCLLTLSFQYHVGFVVHYL